MVIGIQSKFSWKSLGMSVASAVVTAGMNGAFAGVQSAFLQGALQTATASALTQGIGVATGLQKKFDFAGVAAAGVAGGVTSAIGARLGGRTSNVDKTVWRNGDLTKNGAFLANSAGAIAEAATLSAIKGNSFGDNLLASLPSVIGRAALDGAGAKSILGDGWLGTALADPGSVLPKGWITNAANSVISTVGNVVADMVRGDAQGGGGGAIGTYASMRLGGMPFDPTNLGMVTHAVHYGREFYHPGTGDKVQSIWGDHSGDIRELTEITDARWEPLPSKTRKIFERERAEYFEKLANIPAPEIIPYVAPPEDAIIVTGERIQSSLADEDYNQSDIADSAQRDVQMIQGVIRNVQRSQTDYEAVHGAGTYRLDIQNRIAQGAAADEAIRGQARAQVNREIGGVFAAGPLGAVTTITAPVVFGTTMAGQFGSAGFVAATSNVPLRHAYGQENSVSTYRDDFATGMVFFGGLKVLSPLVSKLGSKLIGNGMAAESAAFEIAPASRSLILRPVEIEFPARGLSAAEQRLFSAHLAEQQSTLNRLSLFSSDDLALNLQNYQNVAPQVARARSLARGYLSGSGKGQDAAHALDSVAGGYVNEFASFRDPVQQRIGALWRTRATQIVPGREHMLTPRFDK